MNLQTDDMEDRQALSDEGLAILKTKLPYLISKDITETMSSDLKEYDRWLLTRQQHALGIAVASVAAAWPIGRAVARRFITSRPLLARISFRFAAWLTLSPVVEAVDYNYNLLHQRSDRVKFIMEQAEVYERWEEQSHPSPMKDEIVETLASWRPAMTKEPLDESEPAFEVLVINQHTFGIIFLSSICNSAEGTRATEDFNRLYLFPTIWKYMWAADVRETRTGPYTDSPEGRIMDGSSHEAPSHAQVARTTSSHPSQNTHVPVQQTPNRSNWPTHPYPPLTTNQFIYNMFLTTQNAAPNNQKKSQTPTASNGPVEDKKQNSSKREND